MQGKGVALMKIDNYYFDNKELDIIKTALIQYVVNTDIKREELMIVELILEKFDGSKGQITH